jgi:hypothetical protein
MCDKAFASSSHLTRHKKQVHINNPAYIMTQQNTSLNIFANFLNHDHSIAKDTKTVKLSSDDQFPKQPSINPDLINIKMEEVDIVKEEPLDEDKYKVEENTIVMPHDYVPYSEPVQEDGSHPVINNKIEQ